MTPEQFKSWRKSHGLKQKEAAEKLGLKKRMIQYYETGKRDGKKVAIPKAVALACYAVSCGVIDFDGNEPTHEDGHPARKGDPKDAGDELRLINGAAA